ncbi:amidohydrolase family protein [Aliiglaciecola sp. 3_MG-2023]|uniref:N-acyl-D-amino-acid deacylase family protein n=1 Tax=Aliiglaciecola sp. 3_MG-2023 TaxID=3062644 RepID=UPI0026E27D9A|nr:amidohydrolase family protein [Aliiglaciecola sp. 3_MG-2023]MDO6692235.1 amidohydrolase family protein [Aliiglaciecola sp. 3_MG-2023]
MTKLCKVLTSAILVLIVLTGCQSVDTEILKADYLIQNGKVFLGDGSGLQSVDVAICDTKICAILPSDESDKVKAANIIDASGKIVSPGFIDPHTHTIQELLSKDKNSNVNYLTQGVTTVVNGNDGGGVYKISEMAAKLEQNGIGTNVAMFVGHNAVRQAVLGKENRHATAAEIQKMQSLVQRAMEEGAIGLSSGLYYVPGSYAATQEVVELAKVAKQYGGIYDTHLRDESTFDIGFIAALQEAIDITNKADIHLHLAHIKALGVDAWGLSEQAIDIIEQAQKKGASISADQYPWLASGTKLHNAIMPKWVMADSQQAFYQRLNDPKLEAQLISEITENIRRRGGPDALLVTAFKEKEIVGKTLEQLALELQMSPAKAAMQLVQRGAIRVASFNMSEQDLTRFMTKPWVVTSSDGTNGHPRKYASFPKKFETYVMANGVLSVEQFILGSSSRTAEILGLKDRGLLKQNYAADIIIWDPKTYGANADFSVWNQLSSGIETVWVNGSMVIKNGKYQDKLAGKFLSKPH